MRNRDQMYAEKWKSIDIITNGDAKASMHPDMSKMYAKNGRILVYNRRITLSTHPP